MDKIKTFFTWLSTQSLASKILFVIGALCALLMAIFSTSCGVARSSVTGDRVVDKNVKDSTHYEVVLQK